MEWSEYGAGDGIRTRDINLGKVALYQLSYSRLGVPFVIFPQRRGSVKPDPISALDARI